MVDKHVVNGTSRYANAMNDAQRTITGCAIDNALVDMIDAAAKRDGVKRNQWITANWIRSVNAAGLEREVEIDGVKTKVAWRFVTAETAAEAAERRVKELEAKVAELTA